MHSDRRIRLALALVVGLCAVQAAAAPQSAPPASGSSAKSNMDLPGAGELIDRFVKAIGGEQNIRRRTSMLIEGRFQVPSKRVEGPMVIQSAAPNLIHVEIQIEGVGKFRQGYDGKIGWSLDPVNGPWLAEGLALADLARDSDFYAELNLEKNYKSVETMSRTTFDGMSCYEVRLIPHEGGASTMYFDETTGLLVGLSTTAHLPQGDFPTTTRFEAYREFDGIRIATRTTIMQSGIQQVMIYEKVTHNAVDKRVFELPQPIKALLEAPQPEDAPPSPEPPPAPEPPTDAAP